MGDQVRKMTKVLEKTLKDAIQENKCIFGNKQVLNGIKNSKLIVLSNSIPKNTQEKIAETATKEKIPVVSFRGTSVALGKLCGLQFRISALSFNAIADANVKSIVKESEETE